VEVIYIDNHLLIAVKPAGIPTQPPGDNFLDQAKEYIKKRFQKPGKVFLEPIHRLDKPVSGLVLFARTSKALSRLQEMMRNQLIEKTYFAEVEGSLPAHEGTLEHYLLHGEHRAIVVSPTHKEGKRARLHYRVLKTEKGKSFVAIQLETGRYHQIRAQFSAMGCPVVGDQKYGSNKALKDERIALHHGQLSFSHPVSHEKISFKT
jgi:23S rRNA pseudouridine1911/1915/1917 synthase